MKSSNQAVLKSTEVDRLHVEVGKLFDRLFDLSIQRLEIADPTLYQKLIQANRKRPRVVIAVSSRRTLSLGWYSPNRWGGKRDAIDEIAILPGTTSAGIHETSNTLVHELAHFVNEALEIRDTCRDGRYHNRRFKGMAENFGLGVQKVTTYGYAATTISTELHRQVNTLVNRKQIDTSVFLLKRNQTRAGRTQVKLYCTECGMFAYLLKNRIDEFQLLCGKCEKRLVIEP